MPTQIRGNTQIKPGTITDNEIKSDAAIATIKLADGAEFVKRDGSVALTGDLDAGAHKLTNLGAPTSGNHAATKQYVDDAVTGLLDFKGSTDASGNPNYPAASKGDAYVVSVAGKIGGASGKSVDVGDVFFAAADNAGGTEASVGASWDVLEHNLVGALLAANNLSDVANAGTARTNLGASTVGSNIFTVGNPSAIRFIRINADNSVTLRTAAELVTDLSITNPGTFVTRETPSGTVNGSNTDFVLAHTPTSGSEEVYLNGILQEPGSGNDYTISVATITFASAPASGDRIRVSYRY